MNNVSAANRIPANLWSRVANHFNNVGNKNNLIAVSRASRNGIRSRPGYAPRNAWTYVFEGEFNCVTTLALADVNPRTEVNVTVNPTRTEMFRLEELLPQFIGLDGVVFDGPSLVRVRLVSPTEYQVRIDATRRMRRDEVEPVCERISHTLNDQFPRMYSNHREVVIYFDQPVHVPMNGREELILNINNVNVTD